PEQLQAIRTKYPVRVDDRSVLSSRAILAKTPLHIQDTESDPDYDRAHAAAVSTGRLLAVPLLRDGAPLGVIVAGWAEPGPTPKQHEDLLKVFADQAVIAIENARLLNELRESLEQQTATAEVLRVISSSPTNVQPVFGSIAESAVRLCGGQFSFVTRFDGKVMNFASCFGLNAEGMDIFRGLFPRPASNDTSIGRAILQRAVVEIADVEADAAYGAQPQRLARTVNYRSIVGVPLLH